MTKHDFYLCVFAASVKYKISIQYIIKEHILPVSEFWDYLTQFSEQPADVNSREDIDNIYNSKPYKLPNAHVKDANMITFQKFVANIDWGLSRLAYYGFIVPFHDGFTFTE